MKWFASISPAKVLLRRQNKWGHPLEISGQADTCVFFDLFQWSIFKYVETRLKLTMHLNMTMVV
jgi:hypothetical protein